MRTLRVAVTGLRRAGKTVFLTSLINHLLDGSEETLPAFRDEAIAFSAAPLRRRSEATPFPYLQYLDQLRGDSPSWPARTSDVSEFPLALTVRNLKNHRARTVTLELVDYPGERLLDLPLVSMGYEEWSDQVSEEARVGLRKELSAPWLETCAQLHPGADDRPAVEHYADYLRDCRREGLGYLQPSALLLEADAVGQDRFRFCPLPDDVRRRLPELAREYGVRYGQYLRGYVRPFFRKAARCSRQIVLVDVLHILRRGVHSYNDTRRALRRILDAFGYAEQRHPLSPLRIIDMFQTRVDRMLFVATKADQCTRATRGNLRYLLEDLVEPKRRELAVGLPNGRPRVTFCAAHRSTEDAAKEFEGRQLSCLRGRRADRPADRDGPWFPGEIPPAWPDDQWNPEESQFIFPDFLPARLPMRDGATAPHINLDKVFWHTIEDIVP
ncbi:MAG: YcjX family protein [Candidatus Brocadiaceae bacterium]|nr:YcjX family protein [Candidatus Brocadiaceae bacterium]